MQQIKTGAFLIYSFIEKASRDISCVGKRTCRVVRKCALQIRKKLAQVTSFNRSTDGTEVELMLWLRRPSFHAKMLKPKSTTIELDYLSHTVLSNFLLKNTIQGLFGIRSLIL